jgi:hypothetical protein
MLCINLFMVYLTTPSIAEIMLITLNCRITRNKIKWATLGWKRPLPLLGFYPGICLGRLKSGCPNRISNRAPHECKSRAFQPEPSCSVAFILNILIILAACNNIYKCNVIEINSVRWAQVSRLLPEDRDRIQSPKRCFNEISVRRIMSKRSIIVLMYHRHRLLAPI